MNGHGRLDIVGLGSSGIFAALSSLNGFASATLAVNSFGTDPAGGWSNNDTNHRALANVNGDAKADNFASTCRRLSCPEPGVVRNVGLKCAVTVAGGDARIVAAETNDVRLCSQLPIDPGSAKKRPAWTISRR